MMSLHPNHSIIILSFPTSTLLLKNISKEIYRL